MSGPLHCPRPPKPLEGDGLVLRAVAERVRHVFLLCLLLFVRVASADLRESFETPQATWRYAEADCTLQIVVHRRTFERAHSGSGSEELSFVAGRGTRAYFVHDVGPAPIIRELVPSLWLWSDRAGLQMLARVVLPRSRHPRTGEPLTCLIGGQSYGQPGSWQRLAVTDLPRELDRHVRVLRQQFGPQVDPAEAYVDFVVLNVYGDVGPTRVLIDDLEVTGLAAAPTFSESAPLEGNNPASPFRTVGSSEVDRRPTESARIEGSTVLVGGRPFFARMIDHQGEPLTFLRGLGFNAVKLAVTPPRELLDEAARIGLWLVVPPPQSAGAPVGREFDSVLFWSLGQRLGRSEERWTRQLAEETRRSDPGKRPQVCSADERLWQYSRVANVLLLERPTLGTGAELRDFAPWLLDRPRLAQLGTPVWAAIDTEPPEVLVEQWTALGQARPPTVFVDPQQLRLQAFAAASANVRGLHFRSRARLDGADPATRLRAATLQLVNQELAFLEPWTSGGSYAHAVETGDDRVRVRVLRTERAQLLCVLRENANDQNAAAPFDSGPLSFVVPGVPASADIYRVAPAGLTTLNHRRAAGGLRVTLDDAEWITLLVATQDPLVVNFLSRQATTTRDSLVPLALQIASEHLAATESVRQQLARVAASVPQAETWSQQATKHLDQARRLLESRDLAQARVSVQRAWNDVARVRRSAWEQAARAFPSAVASPYCLTFDTLPLHWATAARLRDARWSVNVLAGGDCEHLDLMLQAGWQLSQRGDEQTVTYVELSPRDRHGGGAALRLTAGPADPKQPPTVIEAAPVWITSGAMPVQRGQWFRVNGWVKVPKRLAGTRDGLLIFDSHGGPTLGERVVHAPDWREFTLYRAAIDSNPLTLTFALTGLGEAWLDDVSVTVLDLGPVDSARVPSPLRRNY